MSAIYFSEHSALRMFEYGLDPRQVRDALANPWLSQAARRGRTEHYVKIDEGCRLLKIVTAVQLPDDPHNDENVPVGATVVVTVIVPTPNSGTVISEAA